MFNIYRTLDIIVRYRERSQNKYKKLYTYFILENNLIVINHRRILNVNATVFYSFYSRINESISDFLPSAIKSFIGILYTASFLAFE